VIQLTIQVSGDDPRIVRTPTAEAIDIGRSNDNSVCIPDSRISGHHAVINQRKGSYWYRDLQSTNGSLHLRGDTKTIVDGEGTVDVCLAHGDVLFLGDVDDPIVLYVTIEDAPTPALAPEGTIVAQRSMDDAADLQDILLRDGPATQGGDILRLLRTIGGEADVEVVFEHVAEHLLNALPLAQTVVLVTVGKESAAWRVDRKGGATPVQVDDEPPPYPRGLVQEAINQSQAILAADDTPTDTEHSLARFNAVDALAVPLNQGAQSLGALVVLGQAGLGTAALDRVVALAYQVAGCFSNARLVRRLRGLERRLRDENRYLRQQVEQDAVFTDIIGQSTGIKEVFEKIRVVMSTDVTVLITGETGTGKELVARAVHNNGGRSDGLFAAVNCAALSENLLESELFGHVKGAFTGAVENKKGLFQVADGGTLFLDEIGELSMNLQAKLLRVLQEGEVTPVGSPRPQKVDVRIVTATHRNLQEEVQANRFREDLFYRINVFPIEIPPLRNRVDDIPAIAQYFLERYSAKFGRSVPGITTEATRVLQSYAFPGNIRELENEMQRAVLLAKEGQPIDVAQLRDETCGGESSAGTAVTPLLQGSLKATMEAFERSVLRRALEGNGWNRSQTARDLGISRQALMVKLSKYDLSPE
jgi:Nif-specific regulatory protein